VGALVQIVASAVGGLIAGWFVVVGVRLQFRRQSEAALRALIIEADTNAKIALQMVRATDERNKANGFPQLGPDPGWLKRAVWDSQLPFVVQVLDQNALALVSEAYGSLETVSGMLYKFPDQPQAKWVIGPSVDSILSRIESSFHLAGQALRSQLETLNSKRWTVRLWTNLRSLNRGCSENENRRSSCFH
jgi:hypothetical protein